MPGFAELNENQFVDLLISAKDNLPLLNELRREFLENREKSYFTHLSNEVTQVCVGSLMKDPEVETSHRLELSIIYLIMERCHFTGSMTLERHEITQNFRKAFESIDRVVNRYAIDLLEQISNYIIDIYVFVENLPEFYEVLRRQFSHLELQGYLHKMLFRVKPTDITATHQFLSLILNYTEEVLNDDNMSSRDPVHLSIMFIGQILRYSQPKLTESIYKHLERVLYNVFLSCKTYYEDKMSILRLLKCLSCQLNVDCNWLLANPLMRHVLMDSDRILPSLSKQIRRKLFNKIEKCNADVLSLAIMNWKRRNLKFKIPRLLKINEVISDELISTELMILQSIHQSSRQPAELLWNELDRFDSLQTFDDDDNASDYLKNFRNLDDDSLSYLYTR